MSNAFAKANSNVKYTSAAHKSNSATFARSTNTAPAAVVVQTTPPVAFQKEGGRATTRPLGGRVPPPSSLDRNDLKRISLRSRAFLLSVL